MIYVLKICGYVCRYFYIYRFIYNLYVYASLLPLTSLSPPLSLRPSAPPTPRSPHNHHCNAIDALSQYYHNNTIPTRDSDLQFISRCQSQVTRCNKQLWAVGCATPATFPKDGSTGIESVYTVADDVSGEAGPKRNVQMPCLAIPGFKTGAEGRITTITAPEQGTI